MVQHSLCDNVLIPILSKEFVYNNYAGQIGKGTLYGLNCLSEHMLNAYNRYGRECWIVKADVSKYFYSIDHDILKDMVSYFIRDVKVYKLCEKFIDSTPGIGVSLGNQVSQVFALLYLSGLDKFITQEPLYIPYYGRYMDDFYFIVREKDEAKWCLGAVNDYVRSLGLNLNNKTQVIPFKNGVKFCGFHTYVTKEGRVVRKLKSENKRAAKKKFRRMVKLVKEDKMSKKIFFRRYNAWKNHISHGDCVQLANSMDAYIQELFCA